MASPLAQLVPVSEVNDDTVSSKVDMRTDT